jgi:hypothetical protein
VSDAGTTVVPSGTTIPLSEFNTKCWDGSGTAPSVGTAVASIILLVPSKATADTPFAACMTGVQFKDSSTGDGGPPKSDASDTGGLEVRSDARPDGGILDVGGLDSGGSGQDAVDAPSGVPDVGGLDLGGSAIDAAVVPSGITDAAGEATAG